LESKIIPITAKKEDLAMCLLTLSEWRRRSSELETKRKI